jgi:quercetin dioxygenase-like cupin family protein
MRYAALALLCVSGLLFAAPSDTKSDALKVAPEVYKLAFENDRVRVLNFVAQPGQKWALHSHPDALTVSLSEYSVRNTSSGQAPTERHSKPGDVRWIPATAHTGENMGSTEMRGVIVELKNPEAPSSTEERAVLASFQALLDGLGKRDKAAMMAQLLPGGSAVLMRNGKAAQMSFEMLADRLSQPGADSHEERIRDAVVHVDGDVATVWAPFEFLVDGKIDHCGRDIANLVRIDGHWIIAAIADNGRKDCGGH